MTEQIRAEAGALEDTLREQERLLEQLYECACRKERALIENDLNGLKRAVENEEDLTPLLREKEGPRQGTALRLAGLLGLRAQKPSLRELAGALADREAADRLREAGGRMSEAVARLQRKNSTVRELLTLKSEYTDTLLRQIAGNPEPEQYGYGKSGEMVESRNPERGIYEVLI
mgnify:CR=1 FL=1